MSEVPLYLHDNLVVGHALARAPGHTPKPETQDPKPETRNPRPGTLNLRFEARNPRPETLNSRSKSRDPKREARNPRTERMLGSGSRYLHDHLFVRHALARAPCHTPILVILITKSKIIAQ